jgi:AmmeMemoRadiSam system protein A
MAVDKKVAVVASGDLAHRLTIDAPAGYSPRAKEFDEKVLSAVQELNVKELLKIKQELIDDAGECGLRPIFFLLGVLGGLSFSSDILSYEGPFGVGYAVAVMKQRQTGKEKKSSISPPAKLARQSLQYFLEHCTAMPVPSDLAPEMKEQAGAFVSLKKHDKLRGCIGTFLATKATIAEEIIDNAIQAATSDPRFNPVSFDELDDIDISVDILSQPEQVYSLDELDVKKYGVIVRNGTRSGLLLPDLEGVNTPSEQVSIAMQKAGINMNEQIELYRFTAKRYY